MNVGDILETVMRNRERVAVLDSLSQFIRLYLPSDGEGEVVEPRRRDISVVDLVPPKARPVVLHEILGHLSMWAAGLKEENKELQNRGLGGDDEEDPE